ncbi:MAG: 4Fe-4S binding protein [Methanobacteriaceae archaeon]|jgi:Fe-S-cluster-containing hydrogenase component 2|nr:4Fe-4S binding protein [Methanobacteriaceae archaeon]
MSQIILTKPDVCDGCMDCVEACKGYNNGSSVIDIFKSANGYAAVVCQNCVNPRCGEVCFKDAITRTEDLVVLDDDTCVGCKLCMLVCPIGAINYNDDGMLKCNRQCIQNEGDTPACVSACEKDCLEVIDVKDIVNGSRKPLEIGEITSFKFAELLDGFCTVCGNCQNICPTNAISLNQGKPIIDKNLCILCDKCVGSCPVLIGSQKNLDLTDRNIDVDSVSPFELEKVTEGICVGCGACENVCPTDALELIDRTPKIDENLCVLCDACVATCPVVKGMQKNKAKS